MNEAVENDRPGFKDTFIAVGQQTLSKRRTDYVYSVGVLVTGLMVLAGLLYFLTPIASIVALVCAIIVMWGRWIILRQVTQDFRRHANSQRRLHRHRKTRNTWSLSASVVSKCSTTTKHSPH